MPSNHLILCLPLLLLPSVFPSIRIFSNESAFHIRWPKYRSFSFSTSTSNEYSGLISFRTDWFDFLLSKGLSRVFSNTTIRKHQFFVTPWTWTNPSPKVISALLCFIPFWFIKGFLEMLYFQMGWGLYKVTQEENVYFWKQIRESLVSGNRDRL